MLDFVAYEVKHALRSLDLIPRAHIIIDERSNLGRFEVNKRSRFQEAR
jgi:hypothetical protein